MTYYPDTESSLLIGFTTCRGNCLSGSRACFASTSLSDGTGHCYLKSVDFFSGYYSPTLPSTSYVKVCSPLAPNPPLSLGQTVKEKSSSVPAWVIVVVILGTLLVGVAIEGGLWIWCCRKTARFGVLSARYALLEYASGAPVQFTYKEFWIKDSPIWKLIWSKLREQFRSAFGASRATVSKTGNEQNRSNARCKRN